MFKKIVALVILAFLSASAFSQNNLSDFKYVVVPMNFDFVKGKNTYRLNTLTRHLFKTNGFIAFYDEEELPADLFNNRCLAMYADVIKPSGGLSTKLQIVLKDCYGEQIFISNIGKTKEKDKTKSYAIAIRKAFEGVKFLNYKYNPDSEKAKKYQSKTSVAQSDADIAKKAEEAKKAEAEVARLKKEVADLKKQKEATIAKAEAEKQAELRRLEKEAELAKAEAEKTKAAKTKQVNAEVKPNFLVAKSIDQGYQLIDNHSNKIVMELSKTAAPNVFTVKGKNAIVFKEGEKWIYSENNGKKELNIKF